MLKIDEQFVLVITRGDHEVNDIKLKNLYDASTVELATEADTKELLGAGFGSLGPVGVSDKVEVVADTAVKYAVNVSCGANEDGFHFVNVNPERDFNVSKYADLRFIKEGDPSPDGKGTIKFAKGIEVGHVFKLGTFYAEKMGASFLNDQGKSNTMIMGCYGIGVSRTLAAIVEQFNDDRGITWPINVAPFHVHVISINAKKEEQRVLADELYVSLQQAGIEVLYDDRTERAGVKFADSDLIGIPFRITVGKRANEGYVEFKTRNNGEQLELHQSEIIPKIKELMEI
jgi:prolyl-tRNA synthetase